ncbi:hypothetical protein CVT24_004869 [Panaeolus cyanescens]|uniref:Succinate dehydrogenase assembly factor 3 n=1 Tax=Panaeolus cyanescens TaxID=181874 RepID=A0A409V9W7_9AGAR|nr:hypothetical protein CVT24_004869 [Panaeolus cyanescens]
MPSQSKPQPQPPKKKLSTPPQSLLLVPKKNIEPVKRDEIDEFGDINITIVPPTPTPGASNSGIPLSKPSKKLYRRLLRAHRNLPADMRPLGDGYVKSEFRRHKEVTNPAHIIGFLSQWKMYLDQIPEGPNASNFAGKRLDPTVFEKLSNEQLGQLYEVMHAAKDVWKPISELEQGAEAEKESK